MTGSAAADDGKQAGEKPAKAGRLGVLPKSIRPPRPWNVTLVCWLGFVHALLALVGTVVGAIVDEDLHLPDPVRPLVHTTLLSDIWALTGTLIVLPFLWLLTLKGSRHARAVIVFVLFARIVFAGVLMHLANLHNVGLWIALLVVVDIVAVFLLFGGHRTSAFFAKYGELRARPPGDYGLDVPWVPVVSFVLGVACLVYSAFLGRGMVLLTVVGMFLCVRGAFYLYASQLGKFEVWREILATLPPPRHVLDVGCGRGMGVVMALQTWQHATGSGVDIWRGSDQSGNARERTLANAEEAGVADRLTIRTEDMTYLSAPDNSVDLVISNMAIHYGKDNEARAQAVREMFRVASRGGLIRIVDIRYLKLYRDVLAELGAEEVTVTNCGIRGWFGGPLFASRLVSARKPKHPVQAPEREPIALREAEPEPAEVETEAPPEEPQPVATTSLATIRFELAVDEVADFLAQLRPALAAIAARPGYLRGYIGQAVDQPGLVTLVLEFEDIGSYRRAISATDVKYAAHPLLYRALDEPNAYEVLHENASGQTVDRASNIADWSRDTAEG